MSDRSVNAWLADATAALKLAGSTTPRLDALVLLEFVTHESRTGLLAHENKLLSPTIAANFKRQLKRRLMGEPLAYITGSKEFYGLRLTVNPAVLIPRPETEPLVAAAISELPTDASVLELGTGSGAIAIALGHNRADLSITVTDISKEALKVARTNAALHDVDLQFIASDLFEHVGGPYDAILANLPYGTPAWLEKPELAFEPSLALISGPEGLDHYRRFWAEVDQHLEPGGIILLEHEPDQRAALAELAGRSPVEISPFVARWQR